MQTWPLQQNCPAFYGDPRHNNEAWQAANLVEVIPPWEQTYEGQTYHHGIKVHKRCAESFRRVLEAIWKRLGKSQAEIDRVGLSRFSGSYNLRAVTGGTTLSMHSYGCAIDFDSENNGFGDRTPAMDRRVVEEFEREGWEWGGHWGTPDGMHFQAAWTRANPPRLGPLTAQVKVTPKQLKQVSKKVGFLDKVRRWFAGFSVASGTTAASMFSMDNLGLVQGWSGVIQGLGIAAVMIVLGFLAFWFFSNVILKMMVNDYEAGNWTPSGAANPEVEYTDAVAEQSSPVV